MSETTVTALAGADVIPASKVITDDDFLNRRSKKLGPVAKSPEPEKEPEAKQKEPGHEADSKADKKELSTEDVLSKAKSGELEDLTDEELALLSKTLGPKKAISRFAELTSEKRAAEAEAERAKAEVATLRAQLAGRAQEVPEPLKDNPYATIKDAKELAAKVKELDGQIEWAEATLDDAADIRGDDIAVTVGENSYTKKQLREYLRKVRKDQKEYLPDVARRLAIADEAKRFRGAVEGQLKKEFNWMDNKEDKRKQHFDAVMADPRIKRLEEVAPEVAAQMPYFFAHAAQSMYARREIPLDDTSKRKEEPPDNPSGGAAASRSPEKTKTKAEKDLDSKFRETGKDSDFISLRAERIAQRRRLS